jgi:hypothetical protein
VFANGVAGADHDVTNTPQYDNHKQRAAKRLDLDGEQP